MANQIPMLWVVACYFGDTEIRRRNFTVFAAALKRQGVPLCVVEMGNALPQDVADMYLHVEPTPSLLWCKESLLNRGIKALPLECDVVCWADGDVEFTDDAWARKCEAALTRYAVVQPHTHYAFMTKDVTPTTLRKGYPLHTSFAYAHATRQFITRGPLRGSIDFHHHHCGFAWVARRAFLDDIGGLYDKCIMGHSDLVMAAAFAGPMTVKALWHHESRLSLYTRGWSGALRSDAMQYQQRVMKALPNHGGFGCVVAPVTLYHWWHGSSKTRNYKNRGLVLKDYDPKTHVDAEGRWTDDAPQQLKDDVQAYFDTRAQRVESEMQAV
jgi:hypothetical protein